MTSTLPQLNHRARRHMAVLFVMCTVLVSAVVVPRPAVAQEENLPGPEWVDDVVPTCKAIPSALLGTASGALGFDDPSGPTLGFVGGAGLLSGLSGGTAATAGATTAGGTAVLSAPTVVAGIATFVGTFCATTVGYDWLFGEKERLSAPAGGSSGRPVNCSNFGYVPITATNKCVGIEWEDNQIPHVPGRETATAARVIVAPGHMAGTCLFPCPAIPDDYPFWDYPSNGLSVGTTPYPQVFPVQNTDFVLSDNPAVGVPGFYDGGSGFIEIPCPVTSGPACGLTMGAWATLQPLPIKSNNDPPNWTTTFRHPVNAGRDHLGYRRYLRSTITCWNAPGDWLYQTITDESPQFDDADYPIEWTPDTCPTGTIPRSAQVTRIALPNTGGDTVFSWNHPNIADPTQLPAPTMQCWVVGVTVCPIYDPDPNDPTNAVQVGGQGGVSVSPTVAATTSQTLLQDGWNTLPQQDPSPTTTVEPNPTTTVVGSTTTTPSPPTTLPPPGDPNPPVPPDPPPPGDEWGTCISDQTDGAFDDVTVNPITWVRAIVMWMVAPIICAFYWLFVPPGGWLSLWDDFYALWQSNELLQIVMSFVGLFDEVGVSSCAPVNLGRPWSFGPEIGEVTLGWCENAIITLVFVVFLGLGVLGMAGDFLRTIATLGAFRATPGGTGGAGGDQQSTDNGGGSNYRDVTFNGPNIGASGSWEDYGTGGSFT